MDDIQPGAIFYAKERGREAIPVRLSSLFRVAGHKAIYGLAFKINESTARGLEHGGVRRVAKTGTSISSLLKSSKELDNLFVAIELDKGLAASMHLEPVKVSRDVVKNIFGRGEMRVRRFKSDPHDGGSVKSEHGFLTGGITNSVVSVGGDSVVLERVGKVRGKGGRPFARSGDGGAPVVSQSGALLGFVVAGSGDTTLVLPAEDVARGSNIEFLAATGAVSSSAVVSADHFALA